MNVKGFLGSPAAIWSFRGLVLSVVRVVPCCNTSASHLHERSWRRSDFALTAGVRDAVRVLNQGSFKQQTCLSSLVAKQALEYAGIPDLSLGNAHMKHLPS